MKKATLIAAAVLVVSGMASARDLGTYRITYEKKVEEIVLGHGIDPVGKQPVLPGCGWFDVADRGWSQILTDNEQMR